MRLNKYLKVLRTGVFLAHWLHFWRNGTAFNHCIKLQWAAFKGKILNRVSESRQENSWHRHTTGIVVSLHVVIPMHRSQFTRQNNKKSFMNHIHNIIIYHFLCRVVVYMYIMHCGLLVVLSRRYPWHTVRAIVRYPWDILCRVNYCYNQNLYPPLS